MTDSLSARIADSSYLAAPGHTRVNFIPDEFRKTVNTLVGKIEAIRKKHPDIEALAACGHSGTMLMGALSYMTGLPQIAVRKSIEGNVADRRMVNGWLGCKGYLIIDDLVSSGGTVDRIVREITAQTKKVIRRINDDREWLSDDHPLKNTAEPVCIPKPVAILLYEVSVQQELGAVLDGNAVTIPMYTIHRDHLNIPESWLTTRRWTPDRCELEERRRAAEAEPKVAEPSVAQAPAYVRTAKVPAVDTMGLYDPMDLWPAGEPGVFVIDSFAAMAEAATVLKCNKTVRCWVAKPRNPPSHWSVYGLQQGMMNVLYGPTRTERSTSRRLEAGSWSASRSNPGDPGPDPPDALLYMMRAICGA